MVRFDEALARRWLYFTLVLATTAGGAFLLADIIRANGITLIEIGIFILFIVAFGMIASSFWVGVIGFLIQLLARDPVALAAPIFKRQAPRLTSRTALIMPVYNEDPERVFAGLEATYRSLRATGELRHFSFFLLSDSTDPAIVREEQRRWRALCDTLQARGKLRYRRRRTNTSRKVGNIADFCQRWGAQFECMVVLDADSVMAGATVVKLAKLMQANPQAGIIQTLPLPVNQQTLFGRFLQFGCRLCSEPLTTGLSYWQLGDGNYYGHNAIIRIRPFVQHCKLPLLPGEGPLSGEILSHDFVEAALMRRAGFEVWHLPDTTGSFEEIPSNILDYAKRDRRWCQGNLQHLRLLGMQRLPLLSRLHLAMGALAYLASPIWLLLITLGLAQLIAHTLGEHDYFEPYQLFPLWEVVKIQESVSLLSLTIGMLLLPKLLGIVLVLAQPARRAAFGGTASVLFGSALEVVFAALIAPVLMVFHTLFVVSILSGRTVAWNPQVRGHRTLSLGEALRYQKLQLLLGSLLTALVLAIAPHYLAWLAPLLAGLLLAAPLAVIASRADLGRQLLAWRLLATPEELQPPLELRALKAAPLPSPAADRLRAAGPGHPQAA